jgi:uncharacterized protein (DUF1778 family)
MDETPIDIKRENERRDADSLLDEHPLFVLDETGFAAVIAAIDHPPSENPRLAKLMHDRAPWD